ncbi:MAG: matrixin family metalloprotease [Vampirovibrio sp.]
MKFKISLCWILGLLCLGGCTAKGPLGNSALGDTPDFKAPMSHLYHQGTRLVWQKTSLTLYTPEARHRAWIETAFQPWQAALASVHPFSFQWVDRREMADIQVDFVERLSLPESVEAKNRRAYIAALTTPKRYDKSTQSLQTVTLVCATQTKGGLPQKPAVLNRVLVHEMGHALGLWGHSTNPYDVMAGNYHLTIQATAEPQRLSTDPLKTGDIRVIQRLYQDNSSLKPF